jgi:hypothetical protein
VEGSFFVFILFGVIMVLGNIAGLVVTNGKAAGGLMGVLIAWCACILIFPGVFGLV